MDPEQKKAKVSEWGEAPPLLFPIKGTRKEKKKNPNLIYMHSHRTGVKFFEIKDSNSAVQSSGEQGRRLYYLLYCTSLTKSSPRWKTAPKEHWRQNFSFTFKTCFFYL